MWSTLGTGNLFHVLVIATVSLEMTSAMKYLNIDPDQIMKELEQYDVQDTQNAVFDPEVYDSVLDEFARFVRDDHGEEQESHNFEKFNANQKAASQIHQDQQHGPKVSIPRDIAQRDQHKQGRHISLSLLH